MVVAKLFQLQWEFAGGKRKPIAKREFPDDDPTTNRPFWFWFRGVKSSSPPPPGAHWVFGRCAGKAR